MAYYAITSLMSTILHFRGDTGCDVLSFYENLKSLGTTLEKARKITGDIEALTSLEAEIIELACSTEDMLDPESIKAYIRKSPFKRRVASWILRFHLKRSLGRFGSTMKKWTTIQNRTNIKDMKEQNLTLANTSQFDYENMMVGNENEFKMMQEQLARGASELEVVSVVGIGGIGKTTLANKIYNDPFIMSRFDIRAKTTVSQDYCARSVLLGLLSTISGKSDEFHEQQDDDKLADRLQKLLKGRRYLIFIDDIWDKEAWDDVKLCFPDNNCGSRILLTTRNMEVAEYDGSGKPPYQMRLLNDDESWNLLHIKVFKNTCFSPEFEKIGKQIALNCKGLPLAIVVSAGLLLNIDESLDEWKSVAENITSFVSADLDFQCMRVLALSYHHLPHHLNLCFLYFAIFPEDEIIFVNKLVKLWAAEGFLDEEETNNRNYKFSTEGIVKVGEIKSIEEVAEQFLKELIIEI